MKTLTIVVPTFNVEKYLNQCLESFVIPEIMDELEVLIINDGSTDSSPQIGQKYVNLYPDTFRLVTKENGGHGSTINKGIEEATGKYFKVVDGDDWVLQEGLINLIEFLQTMNADMVLNNYYWVNDLTGKRSCEVEQVCPGIVYGEKVSFDSVSGKVFFKMHAISYRTEIIKSIPDKIDENCYYVDMEYMMFPLPYIKSIAVIPDFVYMYRIGQPTQSVTIENMKKRCNQHERVVNRLLDYYKKNTNVTEEKRSCMSKIIARSVTSQYKIYLSFNVSQLKSLVELEHLLKSEYEEIYKLINHPAVFLLRLSGYRLYTLVSKAVRFKLN